MLEVFGEDFGRKKPSKQNKQGHTLCLRSPYCLFCCGIDYVHPKWKPQSNDRITVRPNSQLGCGCVISHHVFLFSAIAENGGFNSLIFSKLYFWKLVYSSKHISMAILTSYFCSGLDRSILWS